MIGIDTNILLRFVLKDDMEQYAQAKEFVLENCTELSPGYINRVVACEFAWTLERSYRFGRAEIASTFVLLLAAAGFVFENRDAIERVLDYYRDVRGVGFVDMLVAELNREAGCSATATFDKRARKLKGFVKVR